MADGVIVTNQKGEVVLHNPATLKMLEEFLDSPDLIGSPVQDCIKEKNLPSLIAQSLTPEGFTYSTTPRKYLWKKKEK